MTVKCRTAIKTMFLYFNLCLSVMLDSFSCSFTSTSNLTSLQYNFRFELLFGCIFQGELVYGDYGRKIDLARKTGSLKGKVLMIRQGGNISVKEKVQKLFIC